MNHLLVTQGMIMKRILTLVTILIMGLCFSSFAIASSAVNQLVFFGDSLSDSGNLYKLFLKKVPKSPPYFQGRFTNGPTWAEEVGSYYHQKYNIPYKIFAFGGATAIFHMPTHSFVAPANLSLELNTYLLSSILADKSKVLYGIWIGGNDYLFDEREDEDVLTGKVVDKITWAMTKLAKKGARHFLVLNMPDLSRIPASLNTGLTKRLHNLSDLHNKKLAVAIKKMQSTYPDIKIVTIDIYSIFNDFIDHPAVYNEKYNTHVKNTTGACWEGGMMINRLLARPVSGVELQKRFSPDEKIPVDFDMEAAANFINSSPSVSLAYQMGKLYEQGIVPCDNSHEFLFWDQIHPSSVVHQVLAQVVVESLSEKISWN